MFKVVNIYEIPDISKWCLQICYKTKLNLMVYLQVLNLIMNFLILTAFQPQSLINYVDVTVVFIN